MESKMALLRSYLQNFDEYIFTGLNFNNAFIDISAEEGWDYTWKTRPYQRSQFKVSDLPDILTECHCTTPIVKNCLIVHIPTGRLEFVGSKCMEHFNGHKKRCIDCHIVNRCKKSIRCSECRKLCKLHNEYHDDNAVHEQPPPQPIKKSLPLPQRIRKPLPQLSTQPRALAMPDGYDDPPTPKTKHVRVIAIPRKTARIVEEYYVDDTPPAPRPQLPFIDTPLKLSKHYGRTPTQVLGHDDGHLLWLLKGDVLSDSDKTNLATLLPRMIIQFGKYRNSKTFGWIKANDLSYYRWIKNNVRADYVQYW